MFLPTADIGRHYHPLPYATLVLEGAYEEAGDQGRFQVSPGDVLLHPAFSAHQDVVRHSRTRVLDIPLPFDGRAWPGVGRLADADLVIKTARRDLAEARSLLFHSLTASARTPDDPADRLAAAMSENSNLAIGTWAVSGGLSREWLSRRFRRLYGIDAAVFRLEARTRRAWRHLVSSEEPLSQVALGCGFADQSHMTRAIVRLTGRTPRCWRRTMVTSVQEGDGEAR